MSEDKPCPRKAKGCKYYIESKMCDEDEGMFWFRECGIKKNKLKYRLYEME